MGNCSLRVEHAHIVTACVGKHKENYPHNCDNQNNAHNLFHRIINMVPQKHKHQTGIAGLVLVFLIAKPTNSYRIERKNETRPKKERFRTPLKPNS